MTDTTPDTSAAPYSGPDHGFGDDNALAHEIKQRDWRDAPRTHNLARTSWVGNPTAEPHASGLVREVAPQMTAEAFAPEVAAAIEKQLVGLTPEQRARREPELVMQALRKASDEARILTGVGAGATPLDKTRVNIAYREQELERRIDGWSQRLYEQRGARVVIDRDTGQPVIDPATGQPKLDPIYAMSDGARAAGKAEMDELLRQLRVLQGPEGDRELDEALRETIALEKANRAQHEEHAEAMRRAAVINREARINEKAEAFARNQRNTIGYP